MTAVGGGDENWTRVLLNLFNKLFYRNIGIINEKSTTDLRSCRRSSLCCFRHHRQSDVRVFHPSEVVAALFILEFLLKPQLFRNDNNCVWRLIVSYRYVGKTRADLLNLSSNRNLFAPLLKIYKNWLPLTDLHRRIMRSKRIALTTWRNGNIMRRWRSRPPNRNEGKRVSATDL